MGTRQGTLLERQVSKLFISHGIKAERNIRLNGYEIDVFAKKGRYKIVCQCKQFERSYLNVKDIIHQWSSKKNEIGADVILLVIYGQQVTQAERQLARKLGVLIWDESDLDKVENMQTEGFYKLLNLDSKIKNNVSIGMNKQKETILDIFLICIGIGLSPFLIGLPILGYGIFRAVKYLR